jgi:hypothetical protein
MMFRLLRFLSLPFMSMDSLFLFKLVITSLVGSLWLTGATILDPHPFLWSGRDL